MPRLARVVISGVSHHVVQRGNNRQDVFFVDDDRRVYLALLREQCDRYGAAVLGYCLMTNHIHLIIRPETEASLAQAVGRTHFRYTQYVNQLHGRSGHLWQGRFSSCALGEDHFWAALGYVERNPVRAKLVNAAWQYAWSSAAAHTGEADPSGLLDAREWSERMDGKAWRALLRRRDDKDAATTLRNATHRGLAAGYGRVRGEVRETSEPPLAPAPHRAAKEGAGEEDCSKTKE